MTSLIFFGNEQLSSTRRYEDTPIFNSLLKSSYQIECLVMPANRASGKYDAHATITEKAKRHNIQVYSVDSSLNLQKLIRGFKSDLAVLASFGIMIPGTILNHFSKGIINVHPSLLPVYRGPSPIEAAILNGDTVTGVTLMKLSQKMDAGDVYASTLLKLSGQETKLALTAKLGQLGADLLTQTLPQILNGQQPKGQNQEKATYTRLISKGDGHLDYSKPAEKLVREIRAYKDWPGSRTVLFGQPTTITSAYSAESHTYGQDEAGSYKIETEKKQIIVACTPGWLCIQKLKPAGRIEMPVLDFINGLPGLTNNT